MKNFALLFISICCCSVLVAQPDLFSMEFENKVDQLAKSYEDLGIFSGVVLVAENGNPAYHKAFGLADRSTGRKNETDTRFDIGSMNKSFTMVTILKLIDEGVLKLDDPVGKFLDGFPPEISSQVQIQHLIMHTSGMGDYHSPVYFDLPYSKKGIWGVIEFLQQQPLMFKPGEDQAYSNAGYVVLGAIIEKATGKSYFDVVDEKVVQPLGLENTFLREKYATSKRAIGYMMNMRGELESNDVFNEPPKPDGGFYSTTEDIMKFYCAYFYGDALWTDKVRLLDPMYSFLQEHMNSGGAIPHAGGFDGANTVHFEILRDKISVIVFANMDEVVAEDLGAGILAIIRGQKPKPPGHPAIPLIYQSYLKHGIEYVGENFDRLSANWHPDDPKDWILNGIGYQLMFSDDPNEKEQAMDFFKLNTRLFPNEANVWDSLGEAWKIKGEKEKSVECYQKALKIDPGLESAKKALQNIKSE